MVIMFVYCTGVYFLETVLIKGLGAITPLGLLISAFSSCAVLSFYISLTTKYGVRVGRYVVMAVVFSISLGPTLLSKLNIKLNLTPFQSLNETTVWAILALGTLVLYFSFLKWTIVSYQKTEL